jgi:sterol desaturase/sphingolipid hydroxylase (fatty acid hydroxylase superfamily)
MTPASSARYNRLSPVWPYIPNWAKAVLAATCFGGHLWVISSSPRPLQDPFVLLVSLSVAWNSVIIFASGLALLLIDVYPCRLKWLAQYKIQPEVNVPLPKDMVGALLAVSAFNSVVTGTVTLWIIYHFITPVVERLFLAPGESWMVLDLLQFPGVFEAVWQLAVTIVAEEVLFYHAHRLLHHPVLYRTIHKSHHEWTAPVGIAAIYCHPVEHMLSNVGPAMLASMCARAHASVFYLFSLLAVINTTVVHAGYHFPFVYPSPEHHDFHHEAFTSNFGVTGLCDWFYGTDAAFKARGRARLHRVLFSFAPLPRKR